jgi:hypothetical protein
MYDETNPNARTAKREILSRFLDLGTPSSSVIRFIEQLYETLNIEFFSDKICCHLLEARLVASKFFTIVLGGTAALHAYRAWGAVIF